MIQLLAILFSAAFTFTVSLLAGKSLLKLLRIGLYRSEEWFFGFLLGSGCLSMIVFALTAAHLAYPSVLAAAGAVIAVWAWWWGAGRFTERRLPPLAPTWRAVFGLIYSAFAALYVATALLPEVNSDAVVYHVALPARYLREHGFSDVGTRNMMADLSEGVEMLFLFAFAFGKHSAAKMVHLLYTLALPLGMLSYARRQGVPAAGATGALLVFASPIAGVAGTAAYVDVAAACALFGVFYLVEVWRQDELPALIVAAGLLAGFCYDIKYTAGIAVPYASAYVALHLWRAHKPFWKPVLLVSACAVAMMAPYIVKNAIVTGNPFSPFANRYFPNPVMSVLLEKDYADVMRHWNAVRWPEIPLETTVRGGRLQGVVGPVFLLSPLALLALRSPEGRRVLLAGAVAILPYFASIATRFLVPALPFASLALGIALARAPAAGIAVVALHAFLSLPGVLARYVDPAAWRLQMPSMRAVLRVRPETEFIQQHLADFDMGLLIDRHVPAGEPVFAFQCFQQAYQSHEVIVGWQSSFGHRLAESLTAFQDDQRRSRIYEFRFPEKMARKARLVQTGFSRNDVWSLTEARVFRQGTELPRGPGWRVKASHNNWDVQLAFDNNPVTRWTSGQAHAPGMFVQIDFGRAEAIDGVIAECSRDQSQMHMRLEIETAPGRWETIGQEQLRDAPRSVDLRSVAAATLQQNGVRWLLVGTGDTIAGDLIWRDHNWGMTLVASDQQWKLYRLP